MNKKLLVIALLGAIALLAACNPGGETSGSATLAPSDALAQLNMDFREQAAAVTDREERMNLRKTLAEGYLDKVKTAGLSGDEELDYADLLYTAGHEDEALEIANRLAAGDDIVARNANLKLMDVMIQKDEYDALAEAIDKYRTRFQPTPEFTQGLFNPLVYLMFHYGDQNEPEKAVALVETELGRLPTDAPYAGFNLIDYGAGYFEATGKTDELRALASERLDTFNKIIEDRKANAPADAGEDSDYARTTQGFERLARNLGNTVTRLNLVGSPAPDFTFTNYFNVDKVSLADLKGKVVMIDFWANWCGPCKRAFPSMRKLYDEYKDKGFVILGVTSLQGRFSDGDIQEQQVDEQKELDLTKDFITRHEMNWPIAFSDSSVFDERYGVGGIPTFAVLDKNGIVRMIQVGSGEESERKLQEIVPKLLDE